MKSNPSSNNLNNSNLIVNAAHQIEGANILTTPNIGDSLNLTSPPLYVVLHYTATLNLEDTINILCDPKKEVSAHLIIDRKGLITQLVPFNRVAWHVGKSEWKGISNKDLNHRAIGIELVNAGKLDKIKNNFQTWDKKIIDEKEVVTILDKDNNETYWHSFAKEQLNILTKVINAIKLKYNISEVLTHEEIAPGRKFDPGPAFPIKNYKI